MRWDEQINQAIDYIEENLDSKIDLEQGLDAMYILTSLVLAI